MKLPEYSSFEEKKENFVLHYIDTIEEFRELLKEHAEPIGIYRGINNSNYKIFTSLQRQIIEKDIENFSVENYIKRARRQPILKQYFSTFKIIPSKLSIWSYFQHYGAPTPLIDFTYNITKAIYFAIEKFDQETFKSKGDISDRFSIFFIPNSDLELINIEDVYNDHVEYKKRADIVFNSFPPQENFNYNDLLKHLDAILEINVLEIFMVDNKDSYNEIFNLYNNIRIIAQDGLFINNSNLNLPLEENLKQFFIEATEYQVSIWDDIDTPEADEINEKYSERLKKNIQFQKRLEKNIIHSYEIRKDLITEIRKEFSLLKEDIYPEEIAWSIFIKSLE